MYFLVYDPYHEPRPFRTLQAAKDAYEAAARSQLRYGDAMSAQLHIAPNTDEMVEEPDYILSIGPKGGLRCERQIA